MADVISKTLHPKSPSTSLRGGTMMPATKNTELPNIWTVAKTATITQL